MCVRGAIDINGQVKVRGSVAGGEYLAQLYRMTRAHAKSHWNTKWRKSQLTGKFVGFRLRKPLPKVFVLFYQYFSKEPLAFLSRHLNVSSVALFSAFFFDWSCWQSWIISQQALDWILIEMNLLVYKFYLVFLLY